MWYFFMKHENGLLYMQFANTDKHNVCHLVTSVFSDVKQWKDKN